MTSNAVLEEKIPAEQGPLIFHGMMLRWKSFRGKGKGTNFNPCLWFAKLCVNPHDNVQAMLFLIFSWGNRVSAFKSLSWTHNSARDRVGIRVSIWARLSDRNALTHPPAQPSDWTPFRLTVIVCFSTLKEKGSRETKGQRKEASPGMMPSLAVCALVCKSRKSASCHYFH